MSILCGLQEFVWVSGYFFHVVKHTSQVCPGSGKASNCYVCLCLCMYYKMCCCGASLSESPTPSNDNSNWGYCMTIMTVRNFSGRVFSLSTTDFSDQD